LKNPGSDIIRRNIEIVSAVKTKTPSKAQIAFGSSVVTISGDKIKNKNDKKGIDENKRNNFGDKKGRKSEDYEMKEMDDILGYSDIYDEYETEEKEIRNMERRNVMVGEKVLFEGDLSESKEEIDCFDRDNDRNSMGLLDTPVVEEFKKELRENNSNENPLVRVQNLSNKGSYRILEKDKTNGEASVKKNKNDDKLSENDYTKEKGILYKLYNFNIYYVNLTIIIFDFFHPCYFCERDRQYFSFRKTVQRDGCHPSTREFRKAIHSMSKCKEGSFF
jgi:hypothetical protein